MTPNYTFATRVRRLAAQLLALAVAACSAAGALYLVFFVPSWFYGESVLLAWAWFGIPLFFLIPGVVFVTVVNRFSPWAKEVVTPLAERKTNLRLEAARAQSAAVAQATSDAIASHQQDDMISSKCPLCGSLLVARPFDSAARNTPTVIECQCKACCTVLAPQ